MAKAILIQIYNLLWLLLTPVVLGYFLLRSLKAPAYRQNLLQRFGFVRIPSKQQGGLVIHAVSMGEVIAATPVIEKLLHSYPELPITVTCMSPTGREKILSSFGDRVWCQYLPLDLPYVVGRWLNQLQPQAVIIMETELWPNLLRSCQQRLIQTVVINARLSKKSAAGYRKYGVVRALIAGRIDIMMCQDLPTQKRAKTLKLARSTYTVGNLKFDYQVPKRNQAIAKQLQQQLQQAPLLTAGSTHAGEEEAILSAYGQLKQSQPDLKLAIAPRHPERFSEVAKLIECSGLHFGKRSEQASLAEHDVILIDTMGELLSWYQISTAAFIGGSMIERGGHNPLEAMMFGCPVISGPHVFNFTQVFAQLDARDAVGWASGSEQLVEQMTGLLEDTAHHQKLSQEGGKLFQKQAGATQKSLAIIHQALGEQARYYRVKSQSEAALCWDSTVFHEAEGVLFEQSYWQKRNSIIGHSSGRNTAWFIQNDDKRMVLRHYYRGGLIGKLIQRSFFYQSASFSRSFKEFRLLQRMAAEGLPVPKPVAALYRRSGLTYQASILIELLPGCQDLYQRLLTEPMDEALWRAVGKTVAQMHAKQVYHSDLNCHNILLNDQGKIFLIDFDKCDYRPEQSWKSENLERLLRSFNKEKQKQASFHFEQKDWQLLLDGYQSVMK